MTTRTQTCSNLPRPPRGYLSAATATVALLVCLGGALALAGCDDSAEQRQPGPTPAIEAPTPPKPLPVKPAPQPATPVDDVKPVGPGAGPDVATVVRTYSGCYTSCFTERASKTNRETCKLNCDASADALMEGTAADPSRAAFKAATTSFIGCVNACYDDKSLNSTNRATCVLTCQDAAEIAATPTGK